MRWRLGVLPTPVIFSGPLIVTLETAADSTPRPRTYGVTSASIGAAAFWRNATPISCGPAVTAMRA